jgi:hypothetical protein
MTLTTSNKLRTYRFAPVDKTGWIIGLSGVQCILIGVGTFASGSLLGMSLPYGLAYVPIIAGGIAALTRWRGQLLHEHVSTLASWWTAKVMGVRRWHALTIEDELPLLADHEIVDAPSPSWLTRLDHAGVGVAIDRRRGLASATLPVRGSRFSLCESAEQVQLLDDWAQVLMPFAAERNAIAQITWSERMSTGATSRPTAIMASDRSDLAVAYRQLVDEQTKAACVHETLLTITVDARKFSGRSSLDAATHVLLEETMLMSQRLQNASLVPGAPLSAAELQEALYTRLDPTPPSSRSLAQLAGLEAAHEMPQSMVLDWEHVEIGDSFHRSYWVAEWPRRDVLADWLEPVLLSGSCTRMFTVLAEPIAQRRSQARIERDATRLATDEEQRTRAGFRIGADHRRNSEAVFEREAELVSGHVEFEFVGIITVTASDEQELRTACLDQEQIAAQSGIGLLPLDAHHDMGLLYSLPLGCKPSHRRLS